MNGWSKVFLNGINQIVIEIRRVIELKRINPENANQKMNHYFGLPDNIEKIVAAFERYYKTE